MPHLGAFVPSNYFAFIYVPVYSSEIFFSIRASFRAAKARFFAHASVSFSCSNPATSSKVNPRPAPF
jgi:hypothetical protein